METDQTWQLDNNGCCGVSVVLACRSVSRGEELRLKLQQEAQKAGIDDPNIEVRLLFAFLNARNSIIVTVWKSFAP
eukprot:scaffold87892_cov30-Prasinocladus_malaysianus.AAC.1